MRFKEFNPNRRNDEGLPAIAGGMVTNLGKGGAQALGKAGVDAAMGAVKKVGGMGIKAVTGAGKSMASKLATKATNTLSKQLLKKGSKIPMPTKGGKSKEFEIDDVSNDEVTIINPDASKSPEQPEKMTYKKQDVDTIIQSLGQMGQGGKPKTLGNQK